MPYESLNLGINLTLPTPGTTNWGPTLKGTTWTKISQHQHTGAGDGQQIPAGGIADGAIIASKLALNLGSGGQAATLTPSGSTQTINFATGNNQKLDLSSASGDVTLTLLNPVIGGVYRIWVIQGATFRDLIFPASVKWPQAQAPILTQSNGAIDRIELYYDGSQYFADWQVNWG